MPRASTSNHGQHTRSSRASTPASSPSRSSIVEDIAVQRNRYLSTFEEHASAVRGSPELTLAYQRVADGRRALLPDTAWKELTAEERRERESAMEQILASPADTIDDHLLICFAAHTLLLLQPDAMKELPDRMSCEINARTTELRLERRRRDPMPQQERFRPLVSASPLPDFHRPRTSNLRPITEDAVNNLLASPSSLVGQQFIIVEDDFFYRVSSVEITLDGYKFGVQYEDTRYDLDLMLLIVVILLTHPARYSDDVDFSEMKRMLQDSHAVEV
ncbi:hypothetical protein L210DRAFT_3641218 [Boletus edulis BED1]|uniref:Uncharacterized protein n=1 Tax=Boletus edulis BED1 TaxID=1328754 RepID=A0AAD4C2F4_BOLED|nr:hypothetical protein L210DRAFT_3641218 [Boletus edulis BED1]